MTFTRKIEWRPAFNRVSEGYGRGAMEVTFLLKGEKATIQFALSTGWYHSSDRRDDGMIECPDGLLRPLAAKPYPSDIGYHAREPQYEGQSQIQASCERLDGVPCYYDGSTLNAQRYFDVLTDQGEEALWGELEAYYTRRFEDDEPTTVGDAPISELLSAIRDAVAEA